MKSLSAIGAVALALSSFTAAASCTQASMAGTWVVTGMAHLSTGDIGWNTCTLVINAAGKFAAATSSCIESDNLATKASGIIKLVSGPKCQFDGTLTFTSFGTTKAIRTATLSLDHQVMSGVSGGGSYGPGAIFTMIKTK